MRDKVKKDIDSYLRTLSSLNDQEYAKYYTTLDFFDKLQLDERIFYGYSESESLHFDEYGFLEYINTLFKQELNSTDIMELSELNYYIKSYVYLVEIKNFIEGN